MIPAAAPVRRRLCENRLRFTPPVVAPVCVGAPAGLEAALLTAASGLPAARRITERRGG
ncbi:hypothetical protein I3F58_05965 [Streptomyces sp. MUM 203J]|uniref:hypothetical protein n=1 Tax=Streptomyces sp. MUM 203J TaxID=2791990 RepID=UPI001F03ECBE|nr:hypothetical protein [Streptomyces sp. MUM 203J]MCH0539109.1 hypothetical protein [Streptomyces sp. MUM 203J]